MTQKFTLLIWKMDELELFSSDNPFFSHEFEMFEDQCGDQWERADYMEMIISPIVDKNRPMVDCVGFIVEVLDIEGQEVFRADNNYFYGLKVCCDSMQELYDLAD